jgi:hypothetical protein
MPCRAVSDRGLMAMAVIRIKSAVPSIGIKSIPAKDKIVNNVTICN